MTEIRPTFSFKQSYEESVTAAKLVARPPEKVGSDSKSDFINDVQSKIAKNPEQVAEDFYSLQRATASISGYLHTLENDKKSIEKKFESSKKSINNLKITAHVLAAMNATFLAIIVYASIFPIVQSAISSSNRQDNQLSPKK